MSTRQELLSVIEQLPEEQLNPLLQLARSLQLDSSESPQSSKLDDFLRLPLEERKKLLAQHAAMLAPYFQPGSEEMEWVEEYVEDENWDDD